MLKYLRIAVTALSLTACVLLLALWLRSYLWVDEVRELNSLHWQQLTSCHGWIHLRRGGSLFDPYDRWNVYSNRISAVGPVSLPQSFRWKIFPAPEVSLPHWLLVLLCSTSAAFPWIRWHFSLRTLLIAVTLVALGMGTVIYLAG